MVSVATVIGRPLTSMIWLKKSKVKSVRGPQGKTVSTAGIPYQDALPEDDPLAGGTERERHEEGRGRPGPSAVDRQQPGPGDARPLLEHRGNRTEEASKPTVSPVDKLGVPTYSELVLVARAAGSTKTRTRSASSSRHSAGEPVLRSPIPTRQPAPCSKPMTP